MTASGRSYRKLTELKKQQMKKREWIKSQLYFCVSTDVEKTKQRIDIQGVPELAPQRKKGALGRIY
jgi:hypothetical protein